MFVVNFHFPRPVYKIVTKFNQTKEMPTVLWRDLGLVVQGPPTQWEDMDALHIQIIHVAHMKKVLMFMQGRFIESSTGNLRTALLTHIKTHIAMMSVIRVLIISKIIYQVFFFMKHFFVDFFSLLEHCSNDNGSLS
jgi:hypothetical protein